MADLAKIKLNNVTYNLKDAEARAMFEESPAASITTSDIANWNNSFTDFYANDWVPAIQLFNDGQYIIQQGYNDEDTICIGYKKAGSGPIIEIGPTYASLQQFSNITVSSIYGLNTLNEDSNDAMAANKAYVDNKVASVSHPVSSVNGSTGAITISSIKTTAGGNNVEYNFIGTAINNNNTSAVPLYKQNLLSFAESTTFGRLTVGSTTTPGIIRLYSHVTNGTGYTDIQTEVTGTNARTLSLPDKSGTVALISDIPTIPSWALAANKPTYTASEVGATTSTEVSSMISSAVSGLSSFQTSIVQSLPSTGVTGTFYLVSNSGTGQNIYDEYLWINNNWEKLGTLNAGSADLSGYLLKTDIADWAKAISKPTYTASEVGALPSNTNYVSTFNGQSGAITYIAPVTSVNGQTGTVSITIPTDISSFNNDAGYLTLSTLPKYDGTVI